MYRRKTQQPLRLPACRSATSSRRTRDFGQRLTIHSWGERDKTTTGTISLTACQGMSLEEWAGSRAMGADLRGPVCEPRSPQSRGASFKTQQSEGRRHGYVTVHVLASCWRHTITFYRVYRFNTTHTGCSECVHLGDEVTVFHCQMLAGFNMKHQTLRPRDQSVTLQCECSDLGPRSSDEPRIWYFQCHRPNQLMEVDTCQ